MNLTQRTIYFTNVFDLLQSTNSSLQKREIVEGIRSDLKEDFEYIVEVLTGKHVFGYSYWIPSDTNIGDVRNENNTVKEVLQFLQEPYLRKDLSMNNITRYVHQTGPWALFFEPIVNRRLKLGIGKSILPKDGFAPMLAKKYEGKIKRDTAGYILTEKLDGNRCIASYEDNHWVFRSRNGRLMHVNFDMKDLPKEYVYDGEVMSKSQTEASIRLHLNLQANVNGMVYDDEFNTTSGLINRHSFDKDIVYNIFDIMVDGAPYIDRRLELNRIANLYDLGSDIRILPVIIHSNYNLLESTANGILQSVTDMGGEGVMINLASSLYHHKRTDGLLKLKKVQTIDMKVYDFDYGTGKYEGMVGALKAICKTDDGKIIGCDIGSGLSDEQRLEWALDFSKIKDKIVEVAYFSISQNSIEKGTNIYSLRFPRLKSVRKDKVDTSEY